MPLQKVLWQVSSTVLFCYICRPNNQNAGDFVRHCTHDITNGTFRFSFQLLLGILRLGWITVYLSDPLTRGYMTASAVYVMTSQVKYLFGLKLTRYSGPLNLFYVSVGGISSLNGKYRHFDETFVILTYRATNAEKPSKWKHLCCGDVKWGKCEYANFDAPHTHTICSVEIGRAADFLTLSDTTPSEAPVDIFFLSLHLFNPWNGIFSSLFAHNVVILTIHYAVTFHWYNFQWPENQIHRAWWPSDNAARFFAFQTYIELIPKLDETNIAALVISIICILVLAVFKEHLQPRFKKKFKVPFPIELIIVSTVV